MHAAASGARLPLSAAMVLERRGQPLTTSSNLRRPTGWLPRRRVIVIMLLGVLVQGFLIHRAHVPVPRALRGDEQVYHERALDIARGRSPAPDFIWPPLGSVWIAGFYRLFGPSRLPWEIAQAALFLATGPILYALCRRAGGSELGADVALALYLLDPELAAFAHYLWPEVLHLALMLLGVALLAKSLLGPFLPVCAAVAALRPPDAGLRARIGRMAVFGLGIALVTLPVMARNGVRHGTWSIANSGPFNLWVGLNDPRSKTDYGSFLEPELERYLASQAPVAERNRRLWERIDDLVHARGLPAILRAQLDKQYYRLLDRNSFFTDQLPGGRWGASAVEGARARWLRRWAYAVYAIVLLLAAAGLCQPTWREARGALALPYLFLAYNLVLFLFVHAKTRFRVPFLPVLLVFAAIAVTRLGGDDRSRRSPGRLVAGAAVAALALYVAFVDL